MLTDPRHLFFASATSEAGGGLIVGVVIALLFFSVLIFYSWRYKKVGPNQALIIYGRKGESGPRVCKGGGSIVWPIVERCEVLSLELMTIDVTTQKIYTATGVSINVEATAQVKIHGDEVSIKTASERFLSMPTNQIMDVARQTLEGHLRAIVGTLTVEQIYKDRDAFASKVQEVATGDLANMGMAIDSFTLRDIQDEEGYLDALGKPRTAQVKRDAIIAEAEAKRDADIKAAQANQLAREAEYIANAKVAEAQRDFEIKKAEYQASVNLKKADSDLAYDLQKNRTAQAVKAEEMKVMIIEREKRIELEEKEVLRRQKELQGTVHASAEAERFRIEAMAQAEKARLQAEAEGRAAQERAIGEGQAAATRARGTAEAEIIRAKGEAEALAMEKKAEAWQGYNQAAVMEMVVKALPELAQAVSAPLAKTDKITIVSTGGDGHGAGASKVTKDITDVIAQLPPVIEALTGADLAEIIRALPGLRKSDGAAAPQSHATGGGSDGPKSAKGSDTRRL
ncbi:MAG: flotillin [Planctomycetota bacterium]|nr:MAG: flotillin [Planctomycetota bacterium]